MVLDQELACFKRHRTEWLMHHKGQFALIKGDELLGTFTTGQDALLAGIKRLGNVPFLVKPIIEREEPVQFPALVVNVISAHP